jgi:ABC-type polysaccharide/polyol phosphate export permease
MLHFVTAYQDIVTRHVVPSGATFALLTLLAAISLATGWTVFGRAQKRFAEHV